MDAHHLVEVKKNRNIPEFRAGDTVQVNYRVTEGDRTRTQPFQGVVLRRMGGQGPAACFTVRRVTRGFGVERTFPLHSPNIESVQIQRFGKVRRAKLFYLRERSGRAARIKEQTVLPEWRKAGAVVAPLEEELAPEEELEAEAVDEVTEDAAPAAVATEAAEEAPVDVAEAQETEAAVAEEPVAETAAEELAVAEAAEAEATAQEPVAEAATEEPVAEEPVDEAPAEETMAGAAEERVTGTPVEVEEASAEESEGEEDKAS